ncbi:MAG: tRNA (adenosine(37)-N6)-dimethylallyltransferase MiaA, partial [bacterium]|nr:tRNA (adenosine(37)-N6)-dimethylallyltransferase MiaA [bacterium]
SYIKNLYISGEIVHHLIDVASPKRQFTVAQYKKRAQKALDDIYRRGKLPIICGGTGQYIDTLAYDLPIPNVKPNPALRKKLTNKTTRELFLMLKNLDVRRARTIDSHNPRRLIRALEIVLTTGKPVPTLRHPGLDPGSDSFRHEGRNDKVLWLGLNPPREKLYHNIHKRLLARMRRGMVAEVQKLKKNGISSRRLQALGLEYRYINRYLEGRLSKQEMLEQLEREIRKYAKRQMTWFKRNQQMHWLKQKEKAHTLVRAFLAFD